MFEPAKLHCADKFSTYPEERPRLEAFLGLLGAFVEVCKKEKLFFSPPQYGNWDIKPEVIGFNGKFMLVGIGKDRACLTELTTEEAKTIADEAIDTFHYRGERVEEEAMIAISEKMR